jgi:thiol-disulfide isomerase/thioredoxin
MRTFSAGLLTLVLSTGWLSAQDTKDKAPAKQDDAVSLKSIQQDFNAAMKELGPKYAAANQAGQTEIINTLVGFAEKAVKLAETNAKEAGDAQAWAVQTIANLPTTDKSMSVLRTLTDKGADSKVKALACLSLAQVLAGKADATDNKAKSGVLAKEAEDLYERVIKDFADAKDPRGTPLADTAKSALFEIRNLSVGKKAPDVESKDLDGKTVKLSDHKGKVVVMDIWATWCPPCRAMIPHERDLVKKLKDKPFVLVSVSADAEKKTLTDFIEKEPMPWTHWHNGATGGILKDWNVRFFPTIYVLDHKGVIRFKGVRGEAMDKAVEQLLKELEDEKKS